MALRLWFFGTPAFAVPSLDRLIAAGHIVSLVVTQPDRPRGRGHHLAAPPVKARAVDCGLPVLQPERLRDPAAIEELNAIGADLAVVAAYGKLLPQALLDIPRLGFINVHASLLPRWRGAAPVHRAILAGDHETGVTIMKVALALDTGPMLARATTPIEPDETSDVLEARLAEIGGRLLVDTIDRLEHGGVTAEPQDDAAATYAAKLERQDGALTWARPALEIHNQIRGLHPWPLAATSINETRLQLRRSSVLSTAQTPEPPGTIVDASGETAVVACAPGCVRLIEVQPEGRRAMSAGAFLRGQRIGMGAVFTSTPPTR
jgi:methionyl-tRNA formyltransferase